jgi:putative membrane protein
MYIKRNLSWSVILRFAWKNLIFFIIWAALIVYADHYLGHNDKDIGLGIPFLPLSTIGIAVSFYIGFKNNAAYDRFWEARKIWGGIINYSRTWGNQVVNFVHNSNAPKEESVAMQEKLIYRHIAWINALRLQLRQPTSFSIKHSKSVKGYGIGSPERRHWDEEVGALLCKEDYDYLIERKNTATHLIRKQGDDLRLLNEEKDWVNDFRHMEMMRVLEEFYNLQGKCERIKKTPYPRQFAYFSKVFVWLFVLLLPFGLVGQFKEIGHAATFLTIPFSVLISWVFITMEIVGDNSEDPFEGFVNDVPMTALCRTIEIDLREMLGETDLPLGIQPENDVLM